ncbi:aldehyde dehydrogenase family protein [Sporosarcina sp. FSL W7-1349]|uniref:aldehyde dehydrogenase family protein n=1 Tax=Sporosarcina sp. FSL W7-1349 TaxID=2921561 RepID=UPI0030F513A3
MIFTDAMQVASLIEGEPIKKERWIDVVNPFNGEVVGKVSLASAEDAEQAIESAYQAFHRTMKTMPAYRRSDILRKTAELLEERTEEFAQILVLEAGKPIRDGRSEVGRAVQVLRFAADEAKKIGGELVPMDAAVGGENRIGMVRRRPIGVISAITPFNFPLNLALHKIAPAIAAGNTVVLKPAGKTPLSAYKLVKLFEEAGLPKGALNLIIGNGSEVGDLLVSHPHISKITFTGSPSVGIGLRQKAGLKRVTLELGSNSPNILFDDADSKAAAKGLVKGAFAFSGQVCISAQRIYVQKGIYQQFLDEYVALVNDLVIGDPAEESTDIGPMITEEEAVRAHSWIQEAVKAGASVATGGKRKGTMLEPTIMVDVTQDMKIVCEETFAPIVSVIPFETEEEVIAMANDSVFGLQAGVFTNDINRAMRLADALETGGVWINETSTYRQDNYPYGGIKNSGVGREGVKYAMEDMTEIKFVGIKLG